MKDEELVRGSRRWPECLDYLVRGLVKGRWRLKSKSRLCSYESEQDYPRLCLPAGLAIILFRIVQYWTAIPAESAQPTDQKTPMPKPESKACLEEGR